jgi:hypothetical protein
MYVVAGVLFAAACLAGWRLESNAWFVVLAAFGTGAILWGDSLREKERYGRARR